MRIFLDDMELFVSNRTVQRDNKVPSEPVQKGEPIEDHIKQEPRIVDLTVRLADTEPNEDLVLQKIERLKQFRNSKDVHRYRSPEDNIENVAVQKMQDERSNAKVEYDVRLTLKEVNFTSAGNSSSERAGASNGAEEETKNAGRRPDKELSEEEAQNDFRRILFTGDSFGGFLK